MEGADEVGSSGRGLCGVRALRVAGCWRVTRADIPYYLWFKLVSLVVAELRMCKGVGLSGAVGRRYTTTSLGLASVLGRVEGTAWGCNGQATCRCI